MSLKLLSVKKRKWAAPRKDVNLLGEKLQYNVGVELAFHKALKKLVKDMTAETEKAVLQLFETKKNKEFFKKTTDASIASESKKLLDALTKKFELLFDTNAFLLSTKLVNQSEKASAASLKNSLTKLTGKLTLKTNVVSTTLKTVTQAAISENVSLIKSIPKDYFSRIEKAVFKSITTGNGLQDLIPAIKKFNGVTDRQAKNIALDQTRKIYNTINKERLLKIGVPKFKWLHSKGGKNPRIYHLDVLNGQIFDLDKPPIIDEKTGERGIPGQLINCRCVMQPVIELNN